MGDRKSYVFEIRDELNAKIDKFLPDLRRQHLTAFDVSDSFLIFATSTGLIYFLTRNTYTLHNVFRQLAEKISIISLSRNEKILAVISHSQNTITVINLETNERKYFRNSQISTITSTSWSVSNEEFYFGNKFGIFSVIHMSNFFVKLLFQTPFITLFQLDSRIEQVDVNGRYYLISTMNYIYVYDDVNDKYWEVTIKRKRGSQKGTLPSIGACFLGTSTDDLAICYAEDDRKLVIVDLDGQILRTVDCNEHQFVSIFSEFLINSNVYRLKNNTSSISGKNNGVFSNSKIHSFTLNFIVIQNASGLFFTNVNESIIFSYNTLDCRIKYLKAIGSNVYIQTDSSIHTFQLDFIDKFLKNAICKKQYFLCSDYCLHFIYQNIFQIDDSILIATYINFLQKKINLNLETLEVFQKFLMETERARKEVMQVRTPQISELFDIYVQNESINCGKLFTIFNQFENFDEVVEFFITFLFVYECKSNDDDFVRWAYQIFCKYISQILLHQGIETYSRILVRSDFKEIIKNIVFLLNKSYSTKNQCSNCQYPCPLLNNLRPTFLEIIISLIDFNFENDRYYCTELCENVPFAFLYFLRKFKDSLPYDYLKYCLQLDDCDLIKSFSFGTLDWDSLICYYFDLINQKCLGCHANLNRKISNITWDFLGICMVKDLGPCNTINLLVRHAKKIPIGSFTLLFYNQCLNSASLN